MVSLYGAHTLTGPFSCYVSRPIIKKNIRHICVPLWLCDLWIKLQTIKMKNCEMNDNRRTVFHWNAAVAAHVWKPLTLLLSLSQAVRRQTPDTWDLKMLPRDTIRAIRVGGPLGRGGPTRASSLQLKAIMLRASLLCYPI